MRHYNYDGLCGPMSCVPMRKDGVPEFVMILSCSGIYSDIYISLVKCTQLHFKFDKPYSNPYN